MKRIALVLLSAAVLAGSVVVAGSRPASACSCMSVDDARALSSADAAFLGTVTNVDRPQQPSSSLDPVTWTFAVEGVFKGDVAARQEIVSAFSSASCGIELDVGARYLVFGRNGASAGPEPQPNQFSANLCGGTRPAERNEAPAGFPPVHAAGTTAAEYRMVPSDRTVLPGQVVTITVVGSGVDRWGGGVNSYFERRRGDGSWQRLYMLLWNGGRGAPSIADPNSGIIDLGVAASPFQTLIPAVKPGVYRITRRFLTAPGYSSDEQTLSARVTVKACPNGQRPSFSPSTPTGYQYGAPGCTAKS
jgi:hypothetical protein